MIVFQLFETAAPFAGADPVDAARSAAMLGARPGFQRRNTLPPFAAELRELVSDCWAPDPDARPGFEDVVARLEALLKTMPKHVHFNKSAGCCAAQ
jgi:hypothetical protein